MNLENFDEEIPQPVATREQIETQQTIRMQRYKQERELILTPEVAIALKDGWSYQEIADALGVSKAAVRRNARSQEMQVIIERESRRILRHLSSRNLGDASYRDLTVSMGVLIDKARLLRDEPTEIIQHEEGTATRLAELFFRRRNRPSGEEGRSPVIDVTPNGNGNGVLGLPERTQQEIPEPVGTDDASGDEFSE